MDIRSYFIRELVFLIVRGEYFLGRGSEHFYLSWVLNHFWKTVPPGLRGEGGWRRKSRIASEPVRWCGRKADFVVEGSLRNPRRSGTSSRCWRERQQ